jgi:putative copper export protein
MDAFYQTWFAVRYVHVASAALLVGGAGTICGLSASTAAIADSTAVRVAALLYEQVFWLVIGVSVATGISNLGLKGEGLLGPDTAWGTALLLKLAAVLFLLILSLVRSDFIIRGSAAATAGARRERIVIAALYGLTLLLLLGILWDGLGLAHGRY